MRFFVFSTSIIVALGICFFYLTSMDNNPELLIGHATDGHHQIINECSACHTTAFPTADDIQDSCTNCHAEEVAPDIDTHPMRVFNDPRAFEQLEKINAKQCITCHGEHNLDESREMGVKLQEDMCVACHEEILADVSSHSNFEFTSCSDAGCHNYHNNTALKESYLEKHLYEPDLLIEKDVIEFINSISSSDTTSELTLDPLNSDHSDLNLASCDQCHVKNSDVINDTLTSPANCENCHSNQTNEFTKGKHGMSFGSKPISQARLKMDSRKDHDNVSCNSCHIPHKASIKVDTNTCLSCHDDEHSNNFNNSKHSKITIEGVPMTCSTCHLPQLAKHTNHNQSRNLRPIENMVRTVCSDCHGLQFVLDSLSNESVLNSNFSIKPTNHVESLDMVIKKSSKR